MVEMRPEVEPGLDGTQEADGTVPAGQGPAENLGETIDAGPFASQGEPASLAGPRAGAPVEPDSEPGRCDGEPGEDGESERPLPEASGKPRRFFIDFENVHGAGLKGVDTLPAEDVVYVFYSQAAETFHIEQAIDILKSKAHIEFVEADAGTTNALDFQLITALFGTADHAFEYFIVSGDGGYDAAVKMAKRLSLPQVTRVGNVLCEAPENKPSKGKSRSRRGHSKGKAGEERADAPAAASSGNPKGAGADEREQAASAPAAAQKKPKAAAPESDSQPAQQGEAGKQAVAAPGRKPRKPKAASGEGKTRVAGIDAGAQAGPAAQGQRVQAGSVAGSPHAGTTGRDGDHGKEDAGNGGGIGDGVDGAGDSKAGLAAGDGSRITEAAAEPYAAEGTAASAEEPSARPSDNGTSAPSETGTSAPSDGSAEGNLAIVQHPGTQLGKPRKRSSRGSRGSGKSGKREKIAALLAENGVEVDQHQLSTVMNALNGVKGKQQFYRNFVKEDGREHGGALYHRVKAYYDDLVEIVRQQ